MIPSRDLPPRGWIVIDMDEGTVHRPNVVVAPCPPEARLHELWADPAAAWAYGQECGLPLYLFDAAPETEVPPSTPTP